MFKSILKSCRTAISVFSLMMVCIPSLSFANRIVAPAEPAKRCMGEAMPPEKCEARRAKALAIGCITQEEYQALVAYGSFPTCNSLKADSGPEMLDGWCPCGCFHPATRIAVLNYESGQEEIVQAGFLAQNRLSFDLIHMAKDSRLSRISLSHSPIRISTVGLEAKPLIVIKPELGNALRVTEKHPVLLADGRMVQAQNIKAGDRLLTQKGQVIPVRYTQKEFFRGNVVNFSTEAQSDLEHIIFAEGFAVGDLYWQSSLEDRMNQVTIRK